MCWDNTSLKDVEHLPYRHDQLAQAVPLDHALACSRSISFVETLDHEHVGLPPSGAVETLLRREAARLGRTVDYRVIVSNFDTALRVVASGFAVGIMPMLGGEQFGALRRIKLIPLTDAWARRRFIVCFRNWVDLQPAAQRMVNYLEQKADLAVWRCANQFLARSWTIGRLCTLKINWISSAGVIAFSPGLSRDLV